jgi:hypothetical protein
LIRLPAILVSFVLGALIPGGGAAGPLLNAAGSVRPEAEKGAARPILLAFYHPWYGTPWGSAQCWHKWDSYHFPGRYYPEQIKPNGRRDIASGDYPLIGPYDQGDREVVRWHFRLAKAAGIEGFLCSWWKSNRPGMMSGWQADLFDKVLLPVAQEENFKVAIVDENAHYQRDYDQLVSRVTTYLPRYAAHPAYLKIKGQPVWFIYQVWDDWLKPAQAASYIEAAESKVGDIYWIFDRLKTSAVGDPPGVRMHVAPEWLKLKRIDCFGTYSYFGHWRDVTPAALEKLYCGFARQVREAGHSVQLPFSAGHDNTAVNDAPLVLPRREGALLKSFLRTIDAAQPDIAVVCSFNEWYEMTQVEPSATWADPYLYLKLIAQWRGRSWETPPMPAGPLNR